MVGRIMKNLDLIIISLCVIALSVVGKMLTQMGAVWYNTLQVPPITPENWIFTLVWTLLYILLAVAAVILVRAYKHVGYYYHVLGFFSALVVLTMLWSYLFFVEQSIDAALLDLIITEFILVAIISYTWRDAQTIALLMIPHALWVAFALYLNYQILLLN